MNTKKGLVIVLAVAAFILISFAGGDRQPYSEVYRKDLWELKQQQEQLLQDIAAADLDDERSVSALSSRINEVRLSMKHADFWLRYLEPISYKRINGPLPVEWETEVFEKFEKPYRREGAGLTLAALYLDETHKTKDSLQQLVRHAIEATNVYAADSITRHLAGYHHFYLCNRLFLLNLASIYTTGFECPDTARIIPELADMLQHTATIYAAFNESFPLQALDSSYQGLYRSAIAFVQRQPAAYSLFDHFTFIRNYINPLYRLNQELIRRYRVVSSSVVDYSLSKTATSLFDKTMYNGSGAKGVFLRVKDSAVLADIERVGRMLFYDPILSGNNQRSCASCHKPEACFTDNSLPRPPSFDHNGMLARNTPSLVGVVYQHLAMLDGRHISLQQQARAVLTNPAEMNGDEAGVLKKVLACKEYRQLFGKLLPYTPQEPQISMEHIYAALTYYYSRFSRYHSPFDEAMEMRAEADPLVRQGFNLFMGKAQCGTCHFVPQFGGVKPPFVSSEFEVLGVPADTAYTSLSPDSGRYAANPAGEMLHAFRTGTVRNAARTAPYMHNGVFTTLEQVIDFYNGGGGAGRGLPVANQTLSADSLHLTPSDKKALIAFIRSLDEQIPADTPPARLPASSDHTLNRRKVGGNY